MASRATDGPAQATDDPDLDRTNEKLEDKDVSEKSDPNNGTGPPVEKLGTHDKRELTEDMCYEELGFSWSPWKKWYILTVIFWVQVSMNFNSSLYSNGLDGISQEYGVSAQGARCGAMIFLVAYALGCELWAPWSEEFGRWPILQLSLFLVNIWQLPVALAPNFASIMVGRTLGGLSSAGGSVTLGMIADMWEADNQQYAVAYIVFSSVGGSVLGPVIGGFSEAFLPWQWCIWLQLIFGGFIQAVHFFTVPETRTTILMNRIAKKRRKEGDPNIWGPDELVPFSDRFSAKEILITWIRPFHMFATEPIVLVLSLLSGFSDALIFMFIQAFTLVYAQWNFSTVATGLSFISIGVGYMIAWAITIPAISRNIKERLDNPDDERAQYESRLKILLWTAPCLPIGLFGFAWTIQGPPIHWIGSMIFAAIVGIANYSISAYGPYSASATGGNGFSRDFLAGVLTVPATPFFTNIGSRPLEYGTTILACIASVLVGAVYVIYWKGPVLRKRSPFAQQLAGEREETGGRRVSRIRSIDSTASEQGRPGAQGRSYSQQHRFFGESRVTPRGTPKGTPAASRRNSMTANRQR